MITDLPRHAGTPAPHPASEPTASESGAPTFPALGRPGAIGDLQIRNRVVKSPQATATANQDGSVTARTVDHYRRLGEGGIGLVMVEYSYVDDDASKAIHNQIGISRREHVAGLGWLADVVRSTGAKVGIQIAHGGRQKFLGTPPMKSASGSSWSEAEAVEGHRPVPMTTEEIHQLVQDFGAAAARAHDARFDLVEVHAGHGYLITNFLSPHTNDRTDEYGGSFENRARILLEIVDEIRQRVPWDFPLSVRLSVVDYEPDGITIDETVRLARLLQEHGVDVIHASGGHHALMEWEVSPWFMPRALHKWGWEQIRDAVDIPVIASGSLVSPEVAEEILAADSADFVSLGRAMLADPDWTAKALGGRRAEITPCIRCNDGCLHRGLNAGRSSGCSVNPNLNEERSFPLELTDRPAEIAVVGGGIAGMRSAALLYDRGHRVTLFEPDRLGGALRFTRQWTSKTDLRALVDHLESEVTRRGILVLPVRAGLDDLAGFDEIVLATGAPDRVAKVEIAGDASPTSPTLVSPTDITGDTVVIGGGFSGCDCALRIARECPNAKVTLVEQHEDLLSGDEVFTDAIALPGLLSQADVRVRTATRALSVAADHVIVETPNGSERLPAQTVVIAAGRAPAGDDFADALRTRGQAVTVIGSADRPGRVFDAIHSAYFAGRRL
ncbi:FAD-dependent oxidoreductase [Gordonia neofelifaecis]|uniref:NADH:flavin oxidoreductase n=1 Tax=Gordonia neofelifaecis NRRL B-59395 TaxID=644548 RepID=F1YH05_9ACTN|nr:FAD-dependent oxidoreductase [Gordonia neofelifaecis]EGD55920.1 NADH:flavin oxidoreductase [Gordonia neofelifaecis NRRL B-59395]